MKRIVIITICGFIAYNGYTVYESVVGTINRVKTVQTQRCVAMNKILSNSCKMP